MSNPAELGLRPSIYDRLIDPDSRGTVARPGYSVDQMVLAIQDDLEKLLNTRRNVSETGEKFAHVRDVLGYGMPDLVTLNAITDRQREEIGRLLESIIARYEPRLKEIHVTLREGQEKEPLKVRFHMEAKLAVDPAPDVAFDTTLELMSGHFVHEGK